MMKTRWPVRMLPGTLLRSKRDVPNTWICEQGNDKKTKGLIEIKPLFTNLIRFCNPQRKHLVYQAQALYPWG